MDRSNHSAKVEFWHQVLVEHSQSVSLLASAFCQQKALSVQSFYQWKRKLQPTPGPPRQSLVPVRIVTTPKTVASQPIQLITPGGFSLRFDASIETHQLAKIVQAIEVNRGESC
ncbi:MAG: IS66 family insertion sequence element accessory protein TnpA [Pirellula sp.]|jgi:hypothetical protein|nr:hypothetical protein [Pirellula sp.]